MASSRRLVGLGSVAVVACALAAAPEARADDATVTIGERFSEPPQGPRPQAVPIAVDDGTSTRFGVEREPRELHRAPFRLELGPQGVTTGKGVGLGVGLGLDIGSGSVGGRIAASWLRGEGTSADGTVASTGDAIGTYTAELTLDLHKRGPVHPVIGMGVGLLHVSRPDTSGVAGVGTGRLGLDYSLGLDDADVRLGASFTGGLIGPVDTEVKDLRAYALVGAHLAIGF